MKILLLDAVDIKSCYINIGFATLASVLKKEGHEVEYLAVAWDSNKLVEEELRKLDVDLVGVSVLTSQYRGLERLLPLLKRTLNVPIILGGTHPTIDPEGVLTNENVDAVCIGEGEKAMIEFSSKVESGKSYDNIQNIWTKKKKNPMRPLLTSKELDELPFPDRKLIGVERNLEVSSRINLMAGRGCPYDCSYCINHTLQRLYNVKIKDYTRIRTPEVVLEELKEIKREFKPESIVFNDDTLCYFKDWLSEFLPMYKEEIDLPFALTGRIGTLNDDLLSKLREAGCVSIWIGVESGNPRIREHILKRFYTNEQILETFNLIHKYGMKSKSFNMLGMPSESGKEIMDTIRLNKQIPAELRYIKILTPYPKSDVYEYSRKHNLLRGDPKDVKELQEYAPGVLDTGKLNRYEVLAWRYRWDWHFSGNMMKRLRGLAFFGLYRVVGLSAKVKKQNRRMELKDEDVKNAAEECLYS